MAERLREAPSVLRVEVDRERSVEGTPGDPLYTSQWSLPRIGWDKIYGRVQPVGRAIVAILDTGVDAGHPDLASNVVPGTSILSDSDGGTDPNGHGTWMAGVVAAATDNDIGVAGIGFAGVRIMPVTVLGADGTGLDSDVIAGVVWAVDHGADVINMSFSNPGYSASLQAAIDYAWDNDVVIVAAAGNDGNATVTYPAGDRGVIGVSNTNRDDALHATSNYGGAVFLAAPGTDIRTTAAGGGYASVIGTSAASATVAAAAALIRAVDPSATNGQVVNRLAESADRSGSVNETGNGRLNLARAIADRSGTSIQPTGAGPLGAGGPIVGPYVTAATRTWSGAVSNAWGTAGNWQENVVPVAGSDLIFPAGAANLAMNNNIAAATSFLSLSFTGNGYSLTGNSITLAGGITDSASAGSNSMAINIVTTAVRTITVSNSTQSLAISGVISGAAGGISKAGSGTLRLSGVNTFTGAVTITSGRLTVAANTAMGTTAGTTTVSTGATLAFDGGITYSTAEPVTVNGTGIGGIGAIANLSGTNSFAGPITLGAASTFTSDSGALTLSGTMNTAGSLVTVDGGASLTLGGVISGAGGLTRTNVGNLTLSGTNTYTGMTTIDGGTITVNADAKLGAAPASPTADKLVLDGGTLATTATFTMSANRGISLSSPSTISVASGTTLTYAGIVAGAGGLTKAGAGGLTLNGANSYAAPPPSPSGR